MTNFDLAKSASLVTLPRYCGVAGCGLPCETGHEARCVDCRRVAGSLVPLAGRRRPRGPGDNRRAGSTARLSERTAPRPSAPQAERVRVRRTSRRPQGRTRQGRRRRPTSRHSAGAAAHHRLDRQAARDAVRRRPAGGEHRRSRPAPRAIRRRWACSASSRRTAITSPISTTRRCPTCSASPGRARRCTGPPARLSGLARLRPADRRVRRSCCGRRPRSARASSSTRPRSRRWRSSIRACSATPKVADGPARATPSAGRRRSGPPTARTRPTPPGRRRRSTPRTPATADAGRAASERRGRRRSNCRPRRPSRRTPSRRRPAAANVRRAASPPTGDADRAAPPAVARRPLSRRRPRSPRLHRSRHRPRWPRRSRVTPRRRSPHRSCCRAAQAASAARRDASPVRQPATPAAGRAHPAERCDADRAAASSDVERRTSPVSVFVSRKEGKLYVRQGMEPLFDAPVTIAQPGPADRHPCLHRDGAARTTARHALDRRSSIPSGYHARRDRRRHNERRPEAAHELALEAGRRPSRCRCRRQAPRSTASTCRPTRSSGSPTLMHARLLADRVRQQASATRPASTPTSSS